MELSIFNHKKSETADGLSQREKTTLHCCLTTTTYRWSWHSRQAGVIGAAAAALAGVATLVLLRRHKGGQATGHGGQWGRSRDYSTRRRAGRT